MWSTLFYSTRPGEKQLAVEAESGSWGRSLNMSDSGSHVFPLAATEIPRQTWYELTTPWDRTIVQCWNGVPVYAGLITGRDYNWATKKLTIKSTDIRSMFLARYPFGVNSYWSDVAETIPGRLVLTNLSWRAIAANIVEQGLLGPTSRYALPIVLPSRTESGPHSLTVENFNFRKVADLLDEIQSMDGGPDIEFAPRWSPTTGRLEWVMRTGTPAAPAMTGGKFEFNLTAAKSGLAGFSINEDAMKQVTGVFGVGEGSGADMVVGGTPGVFADDIPARDEVVNYRTAKNRQEASSLAREHVAAHRRSTWEPSFSVRASEVDPTSLVLGSEIGIYDKGDPWNPDGWQRYRLTGISGGVDEQISLTVQGAR